MWEALTNSQIIEKWGAGPAIMNEDEGFVFSLWGGSIWGKNKKVIKNKLLIQDWYSGKWNEPSKVIFELTDKARYTEIILTQSNIPNKEFAKIKSGWRDYYLEPLKIYLESDSISL